jgi:hypothetical protein
LNLKREIVMAAVFAAGVTVWAVQGRIRSVDEAQAMLAEGTWAEAVIVEKRVDLGPKFQDQYYLEYEFEAEDGSLQSSFFKVDEEQYEATPIGESLQVVYDPARPWTLDRVEFYERSAAAGTDFVALATMFLIGIAGGLVMWLTIRFWIYPKLAAL